jgi:hypothetical protein
MNDEDAKDYNNLPAENPMLKAPVEEGDVAKQGIDNSNNPLGAAQDVNTAPDSPFADRNAEEANEALEQAEEKP